METPSIYVGTYAKYNDGSLQGEWVDLTQFSTKEEFWDYIKELHKDEEDPEFMFQDYENIPKYFISESYLNPSFFEYMERIAGLDDDRKEAIQDFINNNGSGSFEDLHGLFSDFEDSYKGRYDSKLEFAEQVIDECYDLEKCSLSNYFDYEAFARDLFISDYWMSENGHVFIN